jgi:hypothetical protein
MLLLYLHRIEKCSNVRERRHDTQHNDIQHNDTQHTGLKCDTLY